MISDLASIAAITALVMISPGPDLALVTRNTLIAGKKGGLWTSAGVLSGNFVHIAYCAAGVGWLIANSVVAFAALKLAGAAYLIFLGIQSLRSKALDTEPEINSVQMTRTFWAQGLLNNLLNPKGALFYLGVFAVFVRPDSSVGSLLLIVLTMTTVSVLFWLVFVWFLDTGAVRTTLQKFGHWVNRTLGLALVALGIRLWLSEHRNS